MSLAAHGLSNAPYLAACVGDVNLSVAVSPSRVRFTVRSPGVRLVTDTVRRSSRRGVVREFSSRSRRRLREVAMDLGELERCDAMMTLTLPGEWESVCPNGRVFKRHVRAMRKRFGRYLDAHGAEEWGALWFLEFQERGAPHLHACFWGVAELDVEELRSWLREAWADVVGHSDPVERAKHLAAGTAWEVARTGHFGYAAKYAGKMRQKRVPEGFADVGRFWGIWRGSAPKPVVWTERVTFEEACRFVRELGDTLPAVASRFAGRLMARLASASRYSDSFTATVYGRRGVDLVLHGGSDTTSSGAGPPQAREASPPLPSVSGRGLGVSVATVR